MSRFYLAVGRILLNLLEPTHRVAASGEDRNTLVTSVARRPLRPQKGRLKGSDAEQNWESVDKLINQMCAGGCRNLLR